MLSALRGGFSALREKNEFWESKLKANPIEWLLEKNNPSVRYFTMIDILGLDKNSKDVVFAKKAIMNSKIVKKIFSKQSPEGYGGEPKNFAASYSNTFWQLVLMAELGVDGRDIRIRKTCELIFSLSQKEGGFSISGTRGTVLPCYTGIMTWALIRFGYLDDPRVVQALKWIVNYQRFDDGRREDKRKIWDGYGVRQYGGCFNTHSCFMGCIKAIRALSEVPEDRRSKEIQELIKQGVEFFLKHRLYKANHHGFKVAKHGWLKFGFPLAYQTDVLEVLGVVTDLGYTKDERMGDAIDLLISKQDENGRWRSENPYLRRMWGSIAETKGKPSKWITLNALRIIKRIYG